MIKIKNEDHQSDPECCDPQICRQWQEDKKEGANARKRLHLLFCDRINL
jgi:hypothetical protein